VLRRFEAIIGDAGLDDLRQLAGALSQLGVRPEEHARPRRPELRRPRLAELQRFVVRIDLRHAKPPIWRRLEVRSDLTLDVVHRVLQAAFGWMDSHLWRFSLGGDPFSTSSQVFLCPWDVEEGEFEDEGGIPAAAVRLDEAIQRAGETLSYAYDYGDNWQLALRLESALPAAADAPSAIAVDGRRAAPPEDCGSRRTADELAEVLEDPSLFALDEVNEALQSPFIVLREHGLDPRLAALIDRLTYSAVGDDLASRALSLLDDRPTPGEEALHASLKPFIWFLDRASDGGIPLTANGYLKPADVTAVAELLPTMQGWIGKANREIDTTPVLHFQQGSPGVGLTPQAQELVTADARRTRFARRVAELVEPTGGPARPEHRPVRHRRNAAAAPLRGNIPERRASVRHGRGSAHPLGLAERRGHTDRRLRPVPAPRS
jgi:hypothetical protein